MFLENESPTYLICIILGYILYFSDSAEFVEPLISDDDAKRLASEVMLLMPEVIHKMKQYDHLDQWIEFLKLVADGKFPMNNISFLLFLDVVQFHSQTNICGMRYSHAVKQFWAVGLRLFRSRFIRFMGGYKAIGQVSSRRETLDSLSPEKTNINFVCPDIKVIRMETQEYGEDAKRPGILHRNIIAFANLQKAQNRSCKISFDGKKISMGFGTDLGEVDLFGHESSPTLQEKKKKLDEELRYIDNIMEVVDNLQSKGKNHIGEALENEKSTLLSLSRTLLSFTSSRIKQLRETKVKRALAYERLQKEAGDNWKASKLAYAISAVRTHLHRIDSCISDLLLCNDDIGLLCAFCADCQHVYATSKLVDLDTQTNYTCLRGFEEGYLEERQIEPEVYSRFVRQKSEQWWAIRSKARVTGSTMNTALGLRTLKEQIQHFDKVVNKKDMPEFSANQLHAMKHGSDNEIHAVATIVGKLLPVFRPELVFQEEGCVVIYENDVFMVVSPDGSGIRNNATKVAFEIKCPVPNKKFTTDVHYTLPKYYVCQIMSEMKALSCDELYYVCFTPESTVIHKALFDAELWSILYDALIDVYSYENPKRPQKKASNMKEVEKLIHDYTRNMTEVVAEFSSCFAKPCRCTEKDMHDPAQVLCTHQDENIPSRHQNDVMSVSSCEKMMCKVRDRICEAYNVVRLPAKEVLVMVLSDLDRIQESGEHAVPIAYGLSGFSLTNDSIRNMLKHVVSVCTQKNIHIAAISSDGQFLKNCVRDEAGRPLTMLQLCKDTWEESRKTTKAEQVKQLMQMNYSGCMKEWNDVLEKLDVNIEVRMSAYGMAIVSPITLYGLKDRSWKTIYTPKSIKRLMSKKYRTAQPQKEVNDDSDENCDDHILHLLPLDVQDMLDDDTIEKIKKISGVISRVQNIGNVSPPDYPPDELGEIMEIMTEMAREPGATACNDDMFHVTEVENDNVTGDMLDLEHPHILDDEIIHIITTKLEESAKGSRGDKWTSMNAEQFRGLLNSASSVNKNFLKHELQLILTTHGDMIGHKNVTKKSATKKELVNMLSSMFGDKTELASHHNPKSLRTILKDMLLRRMNKETTNAIHATNLYPDKLKQWRENAPFKEMSVGLTKNFVWYCQPQYMEEASRHVCYLLDTHHLFVNTRSLICRRGIPELGISREAWTSVAKSSQEETGLNIAMVDDCIDRQSNAIAQIVFSEAVETEMRGAGWTREADFCLMFREWYQAEDAPGISAELRFNRRLRLRKLLLDAIDLGQFPPPGAYVSGMPITMFEGLMTNIDRRIQLHGIVKGGSYNVRAPTSLDSENFFGGFQDLDPKGSGVLHPDDIPKAMETASFLFNSRLDTSRYVLQYAQLGLSR